MQTLKERLVKFNSLKFKWNEMHKIIIDFLLTPKLVNLIDETGKVHKINEPKDKVGNVYHITLVVEKDKKTGFWNKLANVFNPWQRAIRIYRTNQIFICEYYKHRYFPLADKVHSEYNEKLKEVFGYDFVVLDKVS